MFAKTLFASALLGCSALAAPTSSGANDLEKRADWQQGKCQAQIEVDLPKVEISIGQNLYWTVRVIDNPGNEIGYWSATSPLQKDRRFATSKGTEFMIAGQPGKESSADWLTLYYGSQVWNSKDCYYYDYEDGIRTHSHEWKCQFDC